jgi:hypothetical protein
MDTNIYRIRLYWYVDYAAWLLRRSILQVLPCIF